MPAPSRADAIVSKVAAWAPTGGEARLDDALARIVPCIQLESALRSGASTFFGVTVEPGEERAEVAARLGEQLASLFAAWDTLLRARFGDEVAYRVLLARRTVAPPLAWILERLDRAVDLELDRRGDRPVLRGQWRLVVGHLVDTPLGFALASAADVDAFAARARALGGAMTIALGSSAHEAPAAREAALDAWHALGPLLGPVRGERVTIVLETWMGNPHALACGVDAVRRDGVRVDVGAGFPLAQRELARAFAQQVANEIGGEVRSEEYEIR